MTTAAANGHRDGYQAGYADAVKAFDAAQPAAAQEAVTWLSKDDAQLALFQAIQAIKLGNPTDDKMILANLREAGLWIGRYAAAPVAAAQEAVAYLDIGAGGYLDLGSNLPEVQLLALPKGRHALGIIGTYGIDGYAAAPVAAAPVVDGRDVRAAIAGIEGSVAVGSDGEWVSVRRTARDAAVTALRNLSSDCAHIYAAYAEAKASTPAAPGFDLEQFREAVVFWRDCAVREFRYGTASEADALLALIDASPKGGSRGRYFCDGPEGHFFCDDLKLARDLVNAYDKDDDWTITDLQAARAALRAAPEEEDNDAIERAAKALHANGADSMTSDTPWSELHDGEVNQFRSWARAALVAARPQ